MPACSVDLFFTLNRFIDQTKAKVGQCGTKAEAGQCSSKAKVGSVALRLKWSSVALRLKWVSVDTLFMLQTVYQSVGQT